MPKRYNYRTVRVTDGDHECSLLKQYNDYTDTDGLKLESSVIFTQNEQIQEEVHTFHKNLSPIQLFNCLCDIFFKIQNSIIKKNTSLFRIEK